MEKLYVSTPINGPGNTQPPALAGRGARHVSEEASRHSESPLQAEALPFMRQK